MAYKKYLTFSVLGGSAWISSMVLAGYFLGRIPGVNKYLHLIILAVIFISFVPVIVEVWREKRKKNEGGERGSGRA